MTGVGRIAALEDAIRTHRAQKADDRCIEDDDRLYAVLGDGIACDRRVGDKAAMLRNCARFIERRCEGGGWPSYADLELRAKMPIGIQRLVAENDVGCWIWQGRIDRGAGRGDGYGRIGKSGRAHLLVYLLLVGPVGPGFVLDHVCRNRACVNPEHLEPVTQAENEARKPRRKKRA